ncbi:MAG: nucleotidyltransferase [Bacillota bacterium]
MKTIGIIAEFNPFHNGHRHLIEQARAAHTDATIVVVMSGNFVQRGEPSIFDKWTRTEAALKNGADLVLELPLPFATANAETFARGAMRVLGESEIIDCLYFGSESGDLEALQMGAELLLDETEEFQLTLKKYLDQGNSFPKARSMALEAVSNLTTDVFKNPNDILGLEYLMALQKYKYPIIPFTIPRFGEGHHSTTLTEGHASATAIRRGLFQNDMSALKQTPDNCRKLYRKAILDGKAPVSLETFYYPLQYILRCTTEEDIKKIFEVTEGLENRIIRAVEHGESIAELIDYIKSKRYTQAKIRRILLHILLRIESHYVTELMERPTLPYLRVLGFRRAEQRLLGDLIAAALPPVITNLSKAKDLLDDDGMKLLNMECIATDLYTMAYHDKKVRQVNQDYTIPLVII